MWRLAIALIMAVSLWTISPLPTAAQNLEEYFQFNYEPVSFSKNEIHGSEVFYATIRGHVTSTKDSPVSVSEASFTSRVVAEHTVSGTRVTLISSYTVTIKPFPSKEGDTAEINQVVPLQFPAQAELGDYNVIGELIEAKVKVGFGWLDISGYLLQDQLIGSLKYIAPETTPTPAPSPTPTPTPPPTPTPTPTPTPAPTPMPPERGLAWWVWLIIAIAVITLVVNIVSLLRRRTT